MIEISDAARFIIRHKDPHFRGCIRGIDFFEGKGSTSSVHDAIKFVKDGFRLNREGYRLAADYLAKLKAVTVTREEATKAELKAAEISPEWKKLIEEHRELGRERREADEQAARLQRTPGGRMKLQRRRQYAAIEARLRENK